MATLSSGVVPPQIPSSISAASAYSRHSTFTSHSKVQILFDSATASNFALPRQLSAKNPRRVASGNPLHAP